MSSRTRMITHVGWWFGAFAVVGASLLLGACSSSEPPPADTSAVDGGALPDANVDDASPDVDAAEASVRRCSDENFCHTALPAEETLRDVWGSGAVAWAVSEEGDVLRWDGAAWKIHATKLGALWTIWGSGPTDVWIGGERGLIHGRGATSEGLVFEPVPAPGDDTGSIRSIWGSGADDVWAVGGGFDGDGLPRGRVLHWTRTGGAEPAWTLDPLSNEGLIFKRIWNAPGTGLWVGGDDDQDYAGIGGIFRRTPGGDGFEIVDIDAHVPATDEAGHQRGFSAGGATPDGTIVIAGRTERFTPGYWVGTPDASGNVQWTGLSRDLDDLRLWAGWSVVAGNLWMAGDYGRLRQWDGTSWRQAAIMVGQLPVLEPLYAIWGTQADDFWVVGHDVAMHRTPAGTNAP